MSYEKTLKETFHDEENDPDFFDKIAIAFINAYNDDRMESGREEMVSGFRFLYSKYMNDQMAAEVIDDVFTSLCGYSMDSLVNKSKLIDVRDYY